MRNLNVRDISYTYSNAGVGIGIQSHNNIRPFAKSSYILKKVSSPWEWWRKEAVLIDHYYITGSKKVR